MDATLKTTRLTVMLRLAARGEPLSPAGALCCMDLRRRSDDSWLAIEDVDGDCPIAAR